MKKISIIIQSFTVKSKIYFSFSFKLLLTRKPNLTIQTESKASLMTIRIGRTLM